MLALFDALCTLQRPQSARTLRPWEERKKQQQRTPLQRAGQLDACSAAADGVAQLALTTPTSTFLSGRPH